MTTHRCPSRLCRSYQLSSYSPETALTVLFTTTISTPHWKSLPNKSRAQHITGADELYPCVYLICALV